MDNNKDIRLKTFYDTFSFPEKTSFSDVEGVIFVTLWVGDSWSARRIV